MTSSLKNKSKDLQIQTSTMVNVGVNSFFSVFFLISRIKLRITPLKTGECSKFINRDLIICAKTYLKQQFFNSLLEELNIQQLLLLSLLYNMLIAQKHISKAVHRYLSTHFNEQPIKLRYFVYILQHYAVS